MKIRLRTWFLFAGLSFLGFLLWLWLSYPQLEFVNFSVDRARAVRIARDYLRERGEDPGRFRTAAVFASDTGADRYLQYTLGFSEFLSFLRTHDFDLFYWTVRFFRNSEKEGYKVFINPASGEIVTFQHIIDDSAARAPLERDEARRKAVEFLKQRFGFDLAGYAVKGDFVTILDNRSDFSFSWQRLDVQIPWSPQPDSGVGKLLMAVRISGEEILSFSKNNFLIPDQFNRYLTGIQDTGRILSQVVHIFYMALFTSAVFIMVVRRNHLATHTAKFFYIGLMAVSFLLSVAAFFNQWQGILFDYNTAGAFRTHIWQLGMQILVSAVFVSAAIVMPGISGEALHGQIFKEKSEGAFLHYLRSSFFSREVTKAILLGYGVWLIMLGIQAVVVSLGQRYFGVWVEHTWMNNLSTAYLPFLAAFTLGFKASLTEELMYRFFAITLGKKFLGSTAAAVVISSLIWGFSHSSYPVFPMWFRGMEVTCLGLFLSCVYLRFGIIPVIVGHYLFDVFWNCAEYMLGIATPFYSLSAFSVFLLPLAWAGAAFLLNRDAQPRPMRWRLSKHQLYNLEVLKTFLRQHPEELRRKTPAQISDEISRHGWDPAVVEAALEDLGVHERAS